MKTPGGKRLGLLLLAASFSVPATHVRADISISIGADTLQTMIANSPLPPEALLSFIDLGADGVFNPIRLDDGGSQWVSGDDRLLTASYTVSGAAGDFPSAAAFDLFVGADTAGHLERTFTFKISDLTPGTKLGIRWFPGLQASQFPSLSGPAAGQAYGQFTRQDTPLYGGTVWVVPQDGAAVTFDPLLTISAGGSDPNLAGVAQFSVVPEPSAALLLGVVGATIAGLRRARPKTT